MVALVALPVGANADQPLEDKGFVHGPVVNIDGSDYYLAVAPDGPDGATDIPGHYWVPDKVDPCGLWKFGGFLLSSR